MNDRVEFEVLEDIKVSDVIVIPKGGIAWGTVTEAEPKRRMARGGKLEIVMDSVRLTDGEKAALRATKEGKGGGHTGAMTAGIVATAIVFFPAAPFFLFMHGKDITFPKGTEVPTFVDGNFTLDLSKFQQAGAPAQTATSAAEPAQSAPNVNAEINITSIPPGAEVQIDGVFVGNTPSTLGVSSGDHVVTVSKKGFKPWERKVKITTGKVELAADLEVEDK
ncbi:MAG: PEGA domain-containing protein [Candidatus Acidiferrales bacterium]